MADKVYGFSGANKCKKEVISKENYKCSGEIVHGYNNIGRTLNPSDSYFSLPAFTEVAYADQTLKKLSSDLENTHSRKFAVDGLYSFQVRITVKTENNQYATLSPFLDDNRLKGYGCLVTNAGTSAQDIIVNYIIPIKAEQELCFKILPAQTGSTFAKILDIYGFALDWDGKV